MTFKFKYGTGQTQRLFCVSAVLRQLFCLDHNVGRIGRLVLVFRLVVMNIQCSHFVPEHPQFEILYPPLVNHPL